MTTLILSAPLAGWVLPLAQVPDPVFAGKMAGDGIAIDPISDVLHAPCDGEIVPMRAGRHAITLRAAYGIDILMHVGIDTVQLEGAGFESLVSAGRRVRSGEPLLRFDLDFVARRAKSAVTPIILASAGRVLRRSENSVIRVGDFTMEASAADTDAPLPEGDEVRRRFAVPFDHGIHARPAAMIVSALRPFTARVTAVAQGRRANARSTVALMSLGVHRGDSIEVIATGIDATRALAALAPLLAEVATAPASNVSGVTERGHNTAEGRHLDCVVASRGLAVGRAKKLLRQEIAVAEFGGDANEEAKSLRAAVVAVGMHLEALAGSAGAVQQSILAAHIELVRDPELLERADETIRRGKSAAHAWREAVRATTSTLNALDDPHLRERIADLRDIEQQVLGVLAGEAPGGINNLPENTILLAEELLPAQFMALNRTRIAGICMAYGGATSHLAILAAAAGIPTLVSAGKEILDVADGTTLILDAEHGRIDIAPSSADLATIERTIASRAETRAADLAAAKLACRTADAVDIAVYANIGSNMDAGDAVANGAEGCGLLRTEFLYLDRREAPGEEEQVREYQGIADVLDGRVLTIRTLDIGGDKPIPYLPLPREENPALGLRGLRTSLWRPELLRTQLRAILGVTPQHRCRILLPMVNDLDEVRLVRALIAEIRAETQAVRGLAAVPALGIMIETPASALLADQLVREVDFLSIGSNDLAQYTLAIDRGHADLAEKLDGLHPAVLRLIRMVVDAALVHGKEVAICGGLGSDPVAIPMLIGLGIREVSAVSAAIPGIKRLIRSLDTRACAVLAREALDLHGAPAVRALATKFVNSVS